MSNPRTRFAIFGLIPSRGLFAAGFLWSIAQLPLGLDASYFGRVYELANVAKRIAASGRFSDPFDFPTGSTAHVAPLYTLFVAGAFLLRSPFATFASLVILNAVFLGLTAALMPEISRRMLDSPMPGMVGGVLVIFATRLTPQWDAAFSALLLVCSTLAILTCRPAIAGLWCGLSLLSNPASLLAIVVLSLRSRMRVVLPVALAMCAPWMIRNWVVLGAPYFVRDSPGLELWLSNSDRSSAEVVTNQPFLDSHPLRRVSEAELVRTMGEGRYNGLKAREARAWIFSHPKRFLQLTLQRIWFYWFPSPREAWPAYLYWVITALAIAGVVLSHGNRLAMLLALATVAYSLTFALTATDVRHRVPSLWMSCLLAGYAVSHKPGPFES